MIRYGIDVCSYQGDINWKKVKDVGVDFAVLKCIMRGLGPDAKFAANVRGCRENGIPISVYTYVYEDTVEGAENRARAAVNACKEQGLKGCTIWWDVEDKTIRKTGVNARAKLTKSVAAARAIITAAGYTFGVYCDADFYTSCLNAHELGGKWWIAKYGGNPVTTFPGKPAAKKPTIANEMCGWQYCSRGRVAGIKGSVDLNISYDDDFLIGKQEVKKSATGNPYKAPDLIVTSDLQARIKHITFYTSAGEGVRHVQYELLRLGYDIGAAGIDGKAGKKTEAAIEKAQEEFQLTVDGLAGKDTLNALHSAKERPQKQTKKVSVSNQMKLANTAKEVYGAVVKYACRHKSGATTLAEIIKKKITTCSSSVTAALKLAGLMKKGKVGHTKPDGHGGKTKTTLQKAMYGLEYIDLSKFEVVKLFKKFPDIPKKYQEAGIVYVQDSNICISAGNGYVYSNNEGKAQMKGNHYVCTKVKTGYPVTHDILFALKPKG